VVSRHVASQHFLRKLDERANDVELLTWTHRHARGKYGKLTAENLCEQDAHRGDEPSSSSVENVCCVVVSSTIRLHRVGICILVTAQTRLTTNKTGSLLCAHVVSLSSCCACLSKHKIVTGALRCRSAVSLCTQRAQNLHTSPSC
jgi:hypothetical protein